MPRLSSHPDSPARAVRSIQAAVPRLEDGLLRLQWLIEPCASVEFPPLADSERTDGLWQATCFELFLRQPERKDYLEFNFSPSGRWAAYAFDDYRSGMRPEPVLQAPACSLEIEESVARFEAELPLAGLPALPWHYGLSAVIEEQDGTKSYWALAHPPGKPDFHHPACFAATLPAPTGA
jgi:hypothetical protein